MMAVFPLAMTGTTEKQDGTELSLGKQTFPGGCKWRYANWTLMGKGTVTHTWHNFHKDGFLLSTSIERCVDFLARSILCCVPSGFATQQPSEFPTDPTKCTLSFPWTRRELKSQQIKPLLKRQGLPSLNPPCSFFLQASQQLDSV